MLRRRLFVESHSLPGRPYRRDSYRNAIRRACQAASVPEWTPNQLRHNFGTRARREFGIEAARVTLGHSSAVTTEIFAERDIDAAAHLKFFWGLDLSKSQADALLNQLSREWESGFEALCMLLAVSAVVHADETRWSLNSVWAFLSEKARVLVFGCRKDGDTLAKILPKETFAGILVSDDAAAYQGFSKLSRI